MWVLGREGPQQVGEWGLMGSRPGQGRTQDFSSSSHRFGELGPSWCIGRHLSPVTHAQAPSLPPRGPEAWWRGSGPGAGSPWGSELPSPPRALCPPPRAMDSEGEVRGETADWGALIRPLPVGGAAAELTRGDVDLGAWLSRGTSSGPIPTVCSSSREPRAGSTFMIITKYEDEFCWDMLSDSWYFKYAAQTPARLPAEPRPGCFRGQLASFAADYRWMTPRLLSATVALYL